jgi:hypothetical protein
MLNFARNMAQVATYWPPSDNDGFGGTGFDQPREIKCRWQDDAVLYRDALGREQVSQSIVYPAEPLALGGYLLLGASSASDPRSVEGAREIRQQGQSPNLGQTMTLNKVYL